MSKTEIFRQIDLEQFRQVFARAPRAAREIYFRRQGIKAPKLRSGVRRAGAKAAFCTERLFEVLQQRDDDDMVDELLRNYFLAQRSLLSCALDHLGIEHQNGLTESEEVSKIADLDAAALAALASDLSEVAARDDVRLYLMFMGASGVDAALER